MKRSAVLAVLVVLAAACGSSTPEWEATYSEELDQQWTELTPRQLVEGCVFFEDSSDQEIRQFLISSREEGEGTFDKVMADEGIEPTREDIERGLDIAVDKLKENCDL